MDNILGSLSIALMMILSLLILMTHIELKYMREYRKRLPKTVEFSKRIVLSAYVSCLVTLEITFIVFLIKDFTILG